MTDDAPASAAKHGAPAGDHVAGGAVTIAKPRDELFAYWRDFTNLPTFMDNIERVDVLGADRTHWVVKAPGGKTVEWDAITTEERAGELIAWKTAEGADVPNSGRVEFRDAGDRGTVVVATLNYDPPGGIVGKLVAKLFQREPAIQVRRDLRRFKQLMETGEVATARMNPAQIEEYGR